ncbi:hypothetical protein IAT38_005811 [Cryptococcus sp. DSM 104549]
MGDTPDTKPSLDSLWAETKDDRPPTPPLPPSSLRERSTSMGAAHASLAAARSPRSPIGKEDLLPRTATAAVASSSSSTPKAGKGKKGGKVKAEEAPPVLIDDLPTAWDEAHETFETLEKCVYERKDIGTSKENDEMMVCDCVWDKHDPDADPCGPDSDCINRALFIECLAGECRAGKHCRNQQFSKREYADIDVVLTEMKGYGLRARSSIAGGTLIYEYIGEVVAEKTFRKRMAQYVDEGIRHFYFMMLQKEEYIDATKKGGIGRFANHSCNPNSEVQKWVVGRRLRMGIFTKRDILKGEEITFNYNVDRYGHDAQTCYCGEPNCVGTIGGKTQTDIGTMNDLFLDALGITDEVDAMEMKGSKKKKSRQLDEDFVPTLRPIEEAEVQKVAAAMRQSMENTVMMSRLLQRIKLTGEPFIHRQLMRMHGFSLMSRLLTELADNREIVLLALEGMTKWKLQIRNKIEDSNVEAPVKALCENENEVISGLAKQLIEYWSTLELSYKIPRMSKITSLDAEDEAGTTTIAEADIRSATAPRRPDAWENTAEIKLDIAPIRPRPAPTFSRPRPPAPSPSLNQRKPNLSHSAASADRHKLDAIIAMAQQSVVLPAMGESPAESSRSGSRAVEGDGKGHGVDDERRKRPKRSHEDVPEEELAERKEKRLTKLVGEVVVKSMSKYKEQMEHDTFKRYAKECTTILVEKEKKGHTYASSRHPSLSEEKKAKMKAFTKDFAHKVLKRLKAKGTLRKPGSSSAPSHPNGNAHPSSSTHDGTPSTVSMTPLIETPQREKDADLVDDIFGVDDDRDGEAMDIDMDELGDSSVRSPSFAPPTPPILPPPVRVEVIDTPSHHSHRGESPTQTPTQIKQAPVTVKKMSGGYTVERLSLAGLGKINGQRHAGGGVGAGIGGEGRDGDQRSG